MAQSKAQLSADLLAYATNTQIRSSAQKLNLVAQMIRGQKVDKALNILTFCEKRVAHEVKKVLMSAIANAENNHSMDVDSLVVREATVGKALVMKRFRARARGRAGKIHKHLSKLRVVVQEVEELA